MDYYTKDNYKGKMCTCLTPYVFNLLDGVQCTNPSPS